MLQIQINLVVGLVQVHLWSLVFQQTDIKISVLQERKLAGDIYINNLLTDLKTAESEGLELQKEFDWILTLPPSAFASKEMLDWLRKDRIAVADEGDTDSEFGLELTCQDTNSRTRAGNTSVLLPDQVHPSPEAR